MGEFSRAARDRCDAHGIDIEHAYKGMQLDIACGGAIFQRLSMEMRGLSRSNSFDYHTVLKAGAARQGNRPHEKLTTVSPAELRVLEALSRGMRRTTYAKSIGRSVQTIRDQAQNAARKLDARNDTQAVAIAIRTGLIQPPAR